LLAFISRFWLDTKNNDLGEVIRQKQVILESSVQFEKDFIGLQNRINLAAGYVDSRPFGLEKAIDVVRQNLPPDVALASFNLLADKKGLRASVNLEVLSEESLAIFINKLTRDKRVAGVQVGKIERGKLSKGTDINLTIDFADLSKQ